MMATARKVFERFIAGILLQLFATREKKSSPACDSFPATVHALSLLWRHRANFAGLLKP
jgi:hypothetical protein